MRLGVLTSGGDCAGLNAALRAVVHRAVEGYGWDVVGIEQGTRGLMERPPRAREMDLDIFDGTLMRQGGTILGTTNKGDPFAYPMADGSVKDRSDEVIEGFRQLAVFLPDLIRPFSHQLFQFCIPFCKLLHPPAVIGIHQ